MMALSDGRKSFRIRFAVLIQYRSVIASQPATQPPSHVAVAITLIALAKASSLKINCIMLVETTHLTEFECYISLADVVMCVKFLVNRFRGYRVLTTQNCHFPLTCCVALTTVYSLPCDTVIIV